MRWYISGHLLQVTSSTRQKHRTTAPLEHNNSCDTTMRHLQIHICSFQVYNFDN